MKIIATIEARMASSRLPGKSIAPILGKPVLQHIVERLRRAPSIQDIVVATTANPQDAAIETVAEKIGVRCFRGSEDDVLDRVLRAARSAQGDLIFQYGADCPFPDPALIEDLLRVYREGDYDLVCNALQLTYPLGIVGTVFSTALLEKVSGLTRDPQDREDVTRYIWEHPETFRLKNVPAPPELNRPDLRLTVDYPQDLEVAKAIYDALYPTNPAFDTRDIIRFLSSRPDISDRNKGLVQRSSQHMPRRRA